MSTRFTIFTLIIAIASVASAQKKTVNVNGREVSGFNALDYRLQKPLGNTSFPEDKKGFGHNMYLGVNAGGSYLSTDLLKSGYAGYNAGIQLGGWFTPVHGIRVTGNYGNYSKSSNDYDITAGIVRADYMVNFSSLTRGYNPNRKFELLGATGLIYKYLRQNDSSNNNFGIAASLQMRYNFTNSFYMFLEPEVSMLAGGHSGSRLHSDLSLSVGLGYNILTGEQRQEGATRFTQTAEDNIYFGVGGGIFTFSNPGSKFNNLIAAAFLGKMFSSTSGIQLTGRYGHINNGPRKHKNIGIASLDYVLNLNSAFGGYRPNDIFQMYLNVGPSAAMSQNTDKFYAGVHGSLTGLFRLSHNWGIFVSPQIYRFANGFNETINVGKRPLVSVDLGIRYTVGDFSRRFDQTHFTQSDSTQTWFVNAAVGSGVRFRFGTRPLYDFYVGVGKRFTPISSWRFNIEGEFLRNSSRLTANIDYLSSITTAMYGYREDRFFDLQLVGGLFVGGAKEESPIKVTLGAKAGLQANFRITRNWGLYLEPQVLAVYGPCNDNMHWAPDTRMQLGVKYNW